MRRGRGMMVFDGKGVGRRILEGYWRTFQSVRPIFR